MALDNEKFEFLSLFRQKCSPQSGNSTKSEAFETAEKYFLSVFELGLFEVYEFLFQFCKSDDHFEAWIIALKGEAEYRQRRKQFETWYSGKANQNPEALPSILSAEEIAFWNAQGYLQLQNVVPSHDCDAVVQLICEELGVALNDPSTWYPKHDKLQGLMLQQYQGASIEKIRTNEHIFNVFAELYQSNELLATCEKVSYNPPETEDFKFKGSPLHWDMDFSKGPTYYIQGLVYLADVPVDRGAFSLVPAYHHQILEDLAANEPQAILEKLSDTATVSRLAGQKGDLILWLQSIPHAATANHSNLPRFVQYVSFSKINPKNEL